MPGAAVLRYLFESYSLDIDRRELRRGDDIVPVEPQVFDLLAYLVRNRDRVVTKDDLLDAVWNGRIVSESALTTRINGVRTAVDDNGEVQRLIRTLRGRGIRFVGEVRELADASAVATDQTPAAKDRPSIAVLPFENMSGDPEQEYFADGLAEEILTALSKWRWFLVFARNSTFTFKGKSISVKQIGEILGARYVLEGSVRRAGKRIRISARLLEASTQRHIWADRYDRDFSDVFVVQDDIARNVVTAIDPAIQTSELNLIARKPPENMDAWDHFLRGCYHHQLYRARDMTLALSHLHRAIELDPHFAAARARLALALAFAASLGQTADLHETLADALQSANTAVALDGFDASAHAAACYALTYSRQYDAALRAGDRGVELNNNYHLAHYARAIALLFGGSPAESIAEFEMTARLSPLDPAAWSIHGMRALAHYTAKQYEAAREATDRALGEWSNFAGARIVKTAALVRLGQVTEAARVLACVPRVAFFQLRFNCPFRDGSDWEHLLTALEEAGWKQ